MKLLTNKRYAAMVDHAEKLAEENIALRNRLTEVQLLVALRGRANRLVIWNLGRPILRGAGGGAQAAGGAVLHRRRAGDAR